MPRPLESEIAGHVLSMLRAVSLAKFILIGDSRRDCFEAGHPHLIGSIKGQTILIQVLRPGRSLTALQFKRIEQWRSSGATVIVGSDWYTIRDRLIEFGHIAQI